MKIVIAPDSFKGTFTAAQVCETVAASFHKVFADAEIITVPLSDGGEGCCEVLGARKVACTVTGPDGDPVEAFYGVIGRANDAGINEVNDAGIGGAGIDAANVGGETVAVVECASCAGLGITRLRDPSRTTTYGMGELILAAARAGIKNIILSLGGSATNDCGCGLAAALGVRFYGESKQMFVPTGATLANITRIDVSEMDPALEGCTFTAMCDVKNPLYGERGAAYVFAPQKGADAECVKALDRGMRHFAEIAARDVAGAADIADLEGGGAAGGLGACAKIFLGARLESGITAVARAVGLRRKLTSARLCITGEGKLDSQSLSGKVISGVATLCRELEVPLVALCGAVDDASLGESLRESGLAAAFSIQREAIDFADIGRRGTRDLAAASYNLALMCSAFIRSGK